MRSKRAIIFFLIGTFLGASLSCSHAQKKRFLSENVFSEILQEMLVIQFLRIDETQKTVLINRVFTKYHVQKSEFEATKAHYAQDPQFWQDVFKKIVQNLKNENRNRGQFKKRLGKVSLGSTGKREARSAMQ